MDFPILVGVLNLGLDPNYVVEFYFHNNVGLMDIFFNPLNDATTVYAESDVLSEVE